jgi:hypothetical protein
MFRIARLRIRWINTDQHSATGVLTTQPSQAADSTSIRHQWAFNPRNWRVRVSWVGFGSTNSALYNTEPTSEHWGGKTTISALPQVLQWFDPRKLRVRVIWLGWGSMNLRSIWTLGLLAVLLGFFAFTRLAHGNDTNRALDTEKVVPAGLITDDINLGNETIRMIHSPLDIGQAKDVFDNNIETLMRGREANPFVLDLQFSQPQAIKGLMMDFGRMDFVMRVQVYGTESTKPISYEGEYRQQPDIPHLDMDFADGPDQVRRIYIEIEQLNPPAEVHIHIREVLFKE